MSYNWKYDGHNDDTTKIHSIYCARIIQRFPPIYIWLIKLKDGTEKVIDAYSKEDFEHAEDIKAFEYSKQNAADLNTKELEKYFKMSSNS